jgi:alcohol dehydrogenase
LLGVDSAERNIEEKEWLWNQLSSEWKIDDIDQYSRTVSLNDLDSEIKKILEGGQTGRVIVKTE